jgi:hypothetical protein
MKNLQIFFRAFAAVALIAATISCGNVVRSSRSPVMLVINNLQATRGAATAGQPSSNLVSDVFTLVTSGGTCTQAAPCPTVFGDTGTVTLSLALKDLGVTNAATATSNNQVTINRIHVAYRRTDGRNQEGVDVPYAFDTASTATVPASGTVQLGFIIVRIQAKEEAPLLQLKTNFQILSAIIDVTFYGTDIVGNEVSATGSIGVDFGNFGDQ